MAAGVLCTSQLRNGISTCSSDLGFWHNYMMSVDEVTSQAEACCDLGRHIIQPLYGPHAWISLWCSNFLRLSMQLPMFVWTGDMDHHVLCEGRPDLFDTPIPNPQLCPLLPVAKRRPGFVASSDRQRRFGIW